LQKAEPTPDVADKLNLLLSALRELEIPTRDPELGPTQTLQRLEQTTGVIAIRLIRALDAAAAMGWLPREAELPERTTAKVARDEIGINLLSCLAERLDGVATSLDHLLKASANKSSLEKELVNFYAGSVRVEIDLARMQLTIGEKTVDFAALWRVTETIAELTGDFVSTIREWADRVSASIIQTTGIVGKQVQRVVSGVRTAIGWSARRRRKSEQRVSTSVRSEEKAVLPGADDIREKPVRPATAQARLLCALLLDTSGSMNGVKIASLNIALSAFADELHANAIARDAAEVAIITFGGVQTIEKFVPAASFRPPTLIADGGTPMGTAIRSAIQLIDERKATLRATGIAYYRPMIFLITDGSPTDDVSVATAAIREGEASNSFIFAIGTEGADMTVLARITVRRPLTLQDLSYSKLFAWLSKSIADVVQSEPGQAVALPPIDWGISEEEDIEQILDELISYRSVVAYTTKRFPGMSVSQVWTNKLLEDLDRNRYKSVRDIDREVSYALPQVETFARERPDLFPSRTDWVTKSLIFADEKFRNKHNVSGVTMNAATKAAISR
jgi:uncharacterized protein YegL